MTTPSKTSGAKALAFVLNIGADPADSDDIRLIKRIWYSASAVSLPVSLAFALLELRDGNLFNFGGLLFSFFLFLAALLDGARHPSHFERNVFGLLVYFVLAPVGFVIATGGLMSSNGDIMVGLLGPLFALILPDKKKALYLFGLYAALLIVLAALWPLPKDQALALSGFNPLQFWLGFLVLLGFVFGAMYFFVVQRDKAYRLLGLEKEKSEKLLRRIEQDLEQAAEIQKRLLPARDPRFEGFEISGANVSCYQVGGDYYDFIPVGDDRLGVVIADVSGKGISASLLMASLRSALLAEVEPGLELAAMAGRLSDFIHRSSASSGFITFFFGELDRRTGECHYVNAGHNPPFVARSAGGYETLPPSGFPLGMFPGASYEAGLIRIEKGDVAVLFTDGIPEARDEKGTEFGEDRLREFVSGHRQLAAADLCRAVFEEAHAFACETETCDDITLVIIKR